MACFADYGGDLSDRRRNMAVAKRMIMTESIHDAVPPHFARYRSIPWRCCAAETMTCRRLIVMMLSDER